ncbi:hypothetical protein SZN_33746 [Streptomyces zinciresistens K42]|uniref:Uncharacterized protein n=1 Tax=Streptomyces zinciresistens K42 TaxID=700597 RepID=G2GMJ7_9ACTN|nr:hypothetical protein SZN_33746 [Streptomyces zinciresistens K42]
MLGVLMLTGQPHVPDWAGISEGEPGFVAYRRAVQRFQRAAVRGRFGPVTARADHHGAQLQVPQAVASEYRQCRQVPALLGRTCAGGPVCIQSRVQLRFEGFAALVGAGEQVELPV